MEEKMFELLEKLYVEVQDIKSNMATKEDLSKVETRLENKMDENHKVLYDGYKLTYEKLGILEEEVKEIKMNVENMM